MSVEGVLVPFWMDYLLSLPRYQDIISKHQLRARRFDQLMDRPRKTGSPKSIAVIASTVVGDLDSQLSAKQLAELVQKLHRDHPRAELLIYGAPRSFSCAPRMCRLVSQHPLGADLVLADASYLYAHSGHILGYLESGSDLTVFSFDGVSLPPIFDHVRLPRFQLGAPCSLALGSFL
jgi:hypothetical protein